MKYSSIFRWFLFVCVLSFAIYACAQSDSARLTGTITDSQGAVVPGATITLTNIGTGKVLTLGSGSEGQYTFNALAPGRYKVEVKSSGFKTVVQEITLQVTQVGSLNFQLQPGVASDTVEVHTDVPLIEAASSNMSEVIQGRQVAELPLNGRNFTQLALLVPGTTRGQPGNQATGSGNQAETFRYGDVGGAALSVNGLRPQANNFLIDGIDNNESLVNTIIFFPPAEAIQEFRVDTSVAPAQFGRAGGGIVNTAIKSGTNGWHGSAFEFLRNSFFDAREYGNRTPDKQTQFRRNQFGGTMGGALIKNKLFMFGDYQGLRQWRPNGVDYASVPTELMRNGNFSELLPGTPIFDPTTNQPFLGNIIPNNRINPVGQAYLKAYPMPNCGPAQDVNCHLTQNYKVSRSQIQGFDDFDIRSDWNIRANDTLFARYSYGRDIEITTSRLPALPAGFGSGNQENHPRSIAVGENHVVSTNVVNEFRAGWVRTKYGYVPPFADQRISADLGIPGANPTPLLGGGALIGGWNNQLEYTGDFGPYLVPQNTFQYSDNLSWNKGKHTLKFGATILRRQVDLFRPNRGKGYFFLVGNGTQGHDIPWRITGYEVSDVLAGFVDNYQVGPPFGMVGTRNWETGYYAQDDWKVSRRLTVNLGIRYDLITWPVEVLNRQANFDITTGKLVLATDSNRGFVPTDKNNFAPRIGFAYDMLGTGKTILRGGYGIFYFMDRGGIDNQLAQNPPYSGFSQFNFDSNFRVTLSGMAPNGSQGLLNPSLPAGPNNPFVCKTSCNSMTATAPLPVGSVNNVDLNNPKDVTVFATLPTNRTPYVQQWNLQVQQELGANTALSLAYVGTKGTKLTNYYNMNRNPYGGGPKTFPNLGSVNVQNTDGSSIYHGLQTQLQRRMTKGLQFTASYTWSHAIDDSQGAFDNSGGLVDYRKLYLERGNSSMDMRQRFVFNTMYELPFGRGRQFGSDMNKVADTIVGGWEVTPIITLQSGFPFDVNDGYTRLNLVGDPQIGQGFDPGTGQITWFNKNAFAIPNGVPGNVGRNHFYGPGHQLVDLSLIKNFKVTERITTQFQAAAFNLFDTPQFGQPTARKGDDNFGTIGGPLQYSNRQMQFALRLMF
jgi:hypothetical protein